VIDSHAHEAEPHPKIATGHPGLTFAFPRVFSGFSGDPFPDSFAACANYCDYTTLNFASMYLHKFDKVKIKCKFYTVPVER
jgi:hypothetical protein